MNSNVLYQVLGALLVVVGFFVGLGAVVAQIPICGPSGQCSPVDYTAVAGGLAVAVVIVGAGGWFVNAGRARPNA